MLRNDPWRKKDRRRDKKKKDRAKGEAYSSDSDDLSSEFDPSDPLRTKKKKDKARKKKAGGKRFFLSHYCDLINADLSQSSFNNSDNSGRVNLKYICVGNA